MISLSKCTSLALQSILVCFLKINGFKNFPFNLLVFFLPLGLFTIYVLKIAGVQPIRVLMVLCNGSCVLVLSADRQLDPGSREEGHRGQTRSLDCICLGEVQ